MSRISLACLRCGGLRRHDAQFPYRSEFFLDVVKERFEFFGDHLVAYPAASPALALVVGTNAVDFGAKSREHCGRLTASPFQPRPPLRSAKGSVYYFAVRIEGVLSAGNGWQAMRRRLPRLPVLCCVRLVMLRWLTIPTAKSLLIWVSGVAATIIGSWISSRFRIYDDSRKAHLDDIKQKVLAPVRDGLLEDYGPLVSHRSHVVIDTWGVQQQKENVSVTQYPNEDGPILRKAVPDILASTDQALLIDAKKRHFRKIIEQTEQFLTAWEAFASECHAWVLRLSDEILAYSKLPKHPVRAGSPYVMHYRLGVFVYRRLFRSTDLVLYKREPSNWVKGTASSGWYIEGFDGQSAQGTEQQIDALLASLNVLMKREKGTADHMLEKARDLEKHLALVTSELNYAIAARRLHKRCDLVSFF